MSQAPTDAPWVPMARRRRLGRRALLVGVPALALVGVLVIGGPPSLPRLLALVGLVALAAAGWWWVGRSAGPRAQRAPGAADARWHQDLDEARAEWALRHHAYVGEGARRRIEAKAERDARYRLAVGVAVAQAGLGLGWLVGTTGRDHVLLGVLWLAIAAAGATRAVVRTRRARRWLSHPPAAPVPARSVTS